MEIPLVLSPRGQETAAESYDKVVEQALIQGRDPEQVVSDLLMHRKPELLESVLLAAWLHQKTGVMLNQALRKAGVYNG